MSTQTAIFLCILFLLMLMGDSVPRVYAEALPPQAAAPLELETAHLLRAWLLGQKDYLVNPLENSGKDSHVRLRHWGEFIRLQNLPDPGQREAGMRTLMDESQSRQLKAVILKSIADNPEYKSRQARFIQKYGFYSNWFNRIVFSANRLVQGKVVSLLQLVVDGIHDVASGGRVDSTTRRTYYYENQYRSESRLDHPDPKHLSRLRKKIEHSLAKVDYEQAVWHLKSEEPDVALFYAHQALHLDPEWGKPLKIVDRAEAELGNQLREGLTSSQFSAAKNSFEDPAEQALARKWLARESTEIFNADTGHGLLGAVIRDLPAPEKGRGDMMQSWPNHLVEYENAPDSQRFWMAELLSCRTMNLDNRLQMAVSRNRYQKLKYIFLGPNHPGGHLYKTSSWLSQSLDALHNIGFLYLFEMLGRMVKVTLADMPAEDQLIDIMADWLKEQNKPHDDRALSISGELSGYYMNLNRYQSARDLLREFGLITSKKEAKIDRKEYDWLSGQLDPGSEDPRNQVILARLKELDPVRFENHPVKPEDEVGKEVRKWSLDWDMIRQITRTQLPAQLPGRVLWFDEQVSNGEVMMSGLELSTLPDDENQLLCEYPVMGQGRTILFSTRVRKDELHPKLLKWMYLSDEQIREADDAILRLERMGFPFELSTSAGLTGMDFYPRLLPIGDNGNEDDALFVD
jgi:hypothetical protein